MAAIGQGTPASNTIRDRYLVDTSHGIVKKKKKSDIIDNIIVVGLFVENNNTTTYYISSHKPTRL